MNINDYNKVTDRLSPSERCRNEVLNMKTEKKSKRNIKISRKGIVAIVAAAVLACGGTVVYAAEKLGAFNKVSESLETPAVFPDGNELEKDKYEHHDFQQIAEAAKPFTEPINFEGDNISVTAESLYCDGNSIIMSFTATLKDGNPNGYQYIQFTPILTIGDEKYSQYSHQMNGLALTKSMFYLDNGATNSFSGQLLFTFTELDKISEATDIEFVFQDFKPNNEYYGCVPVNYTGLDDKFTVTLNVAPDDSLIRHIDHTFTDSDGYSVTIYGITPAGLQEKVVYDDEMGNYYPYYNDGVSSNGLTPKIYSIWTDSNGNELEVIGRFAEITVGDDYLSYRQPPTSDIINIKTYDANNLNENGESTLINEMTIDLENLTVIE